MVLTEIRIDELQTNLNALLENLCMPYTEQQQEIYKLSQELDELIVQYYREN